MQSAAQPAAGAPEIGGHWSMAWRRLVRNRLAMAALVFIVVVGLAAAFAPFISRYGPAKQHYDAILVGPSAEHWLGTDSLGRDTWSRLVYGARTSLAVGIFAQVIVLAIGLPIGTLAGYWGGRRDNLMMRGVDIVYAFPDLLFIILLRSVLGGGIFMIFLAIGLVSWTTIARLIRSQVLVAKQADYVTAARAVGASSPRVLMAHIMPNSMSAIIVFVTFAIPRAIFVEAALSYIGIGIRPPTASWGTMLQDGYSVIFAGPYLVLFPALAIAFLMLAFTFLGDGLRDALDPRMAAPNWRGT